MGKAASTDEHLLGTAAGRETARTVTRRPEGKRWSQHLFAQVVCTPWEPKASLSPQPQLPRQRYITKAIVERLGATPGCAACAGLGGPHTHNCRARLEKILAEEDERATRATLAAPPPAAPKETANAAPAAEVPAAAAPPGAANPEGPRPSGESRARGREEQPKGQIRSAERRKASRWRRPR